MADHLDNETSVSVALKDAGVEAKAKSRFIAAVDRLGGNLVELVNAPLERTIVRQRSVAASEAKFIEAVAQYGLDRLHDDPAFAERSIKRHLERLCQKQANKDAVLKAALEDLREEPPSQATSASGPDCIETDVLDRIERHAEEAGTEQLRQKWGRVLSAEVKAPGTFTMKALRVVDELDKGTADLFQNFVQHSFDRAVPKCLSGELPFHELSRLIMAELVVDPGIAGHVRRFMEVQNERGDKMWLTAAGERALAFPSDIPSNLIEAAGPQAPIRFDKNVPTMPIYILTDAGQALATILPKTDAFDRYETELRGQLKETEVIRFARDGDYGWKPVAYNPA